MGGNAKIIKYGNKVSLLSYKTIVCSYDFKTKNLYKNWSGYSSITWRHIIRFFYYIDIDKLSIDDFYKLKEYKINKHIKYLDDRYNK